MAKVPRYVMNLRWELLLDSSRLINVVQYLHQSLALSLNRFTRFHLEPERGKAQLCNHLFVELVGHIDTGINLQ